MRVKLDTGYTFDMQLTEQEHQDTFSDEKYRALAYGSPQGKVLQTLVDTHWIEWLEIVETAPWLRSWTRSPLYVKKQSTQAVVVDDPSGKTLPNAAHFKQYRIANAIYSNAVWGYGLSNWLRGEAAVAKTALHTIYKLQNLTRPNPLRNYTWDDKIYRGCGALVPCEFGELDRWLEPLWLEAQQSLG